MYHTLEIYKEVIRMAKVVIPAVTLAITVGVGSMFASMVKSVSPLFSAVRR